MPYKLLQTTLVTLAALVVATKLRDVFVVMTVDRRLPPRK
jgi:hypothetical protein